MLVAQGPAYNIYDATPQGDKSRKTVSTAGLVVDRVPFLGTIQRDDQNSTALFDEHGHCMTPPAWAPPVAKESDDVVR